MSGNDGVFLYIGIVAIWAGFLIPAWIRRPHTSQADLTAPAQVSHDATDRSEEAEALESVEDGDEADALESDKYYRTSRQQYREHVPPATSSPSAARPPARAAGPSNSRQQMLRARRRMLTILVALSLLTGGFVLMGLVQWWICVPPIAMLALYVLLLREIAMADAELAAKRATWEARARAAHAELVARQRQHAQWAAMAAEQGAEIIDISGRVGDQLYDQYADAAVRAVGD